MRVLHVAALPFPSPQGTQALLASMLNAHALAGDDAHLLCYPHGLGVADSEVVDPRVIVHRVTSPMVPLSLRSGPSFEKVLLDLFLCGALRRLVRQLRPELVVVHHVEAAFCARAVGLTNAVFCAHTSLRAELPSYFPRFLSPAMAAFGGRLDSSLVRAMKRVVTVSPRLSALLSAEAHRPVHTLALPWPLLSAPTADESAQARGFLGFAADDLVVAYVGNLDRYQGLPHLLQSLALLFEREPRAVWLVATAGPESELRELLRSAPTVAQRTRHVRLDGETTRARVHAAASVVAVPRAVPGGLPIKLLDALARGASVVAVEAATASYPMARACSVVPDGDVVAFASALAKTAARPHDPVCVQGWIRQHFTAAAYLAQLTSFAPPRA